MLQNRYLKEVRRLGAAVYNCSNLAEYNSGMFPPTTNLLGYRNVWIDGHSFIGFPELMCNGLFEVPSEHERFADLSCSLTDRTGTRQVLVGKHFLEDTLIEELNAGLTLPNVVIRTNGERVWLAHYGNNKPRINPRPLTNDTIVVFGLTPDFSW